MNGEAGGAHAEALARRSGSCWNPRVLLLGPAIVQLLVAYLVYQDFRSGARVTPVRVAVLLLALSGSATIVAGVFGHSRWLLRIGVLSALLGFALPAAILAAASPVDKIASAVTVIGEFDAEGLGILLFFRMLVELPFWGLYAVISLAGYVGSRRAANNAAPGHARTGPRRP